MLSIENRKLVSILFRHAYYQTKRSSDFTLVPTTACLRRLEEHGLTVKSTSGQTMVLQQMEALAPALPLTAPVCLSFLVYLNNSLLWNVTNVPASANPDAAHLRQFYLTNLKDDGTWQSVPTKQAHLSAQDALPVLKSSRFTLNIPKGQTTEIKIRKLLLAEGWKPFRNIPVQPDQEVVLVNLAEPGYYEITKGLAGETPAKIVVSDDAVRAGNFFAILDLWIDNNTNEGSECIAYIDNRLLEWHYVLIDIKSKKVQYGDPSGITISYARHTADTESPSPVTFARLAEADMDDKLKQLVQQIRDGSPDSVENVFVFKSDVPVPLMEHRPPTVKLGMNGVSSFASLPVPDISTVRIRGNSSLVYYNI
ncbi:hypothetical protein LZD49_27880 [Dyadobacter sp. CY261]|uniref:hypothetical protein n=1 Tax=Dyadobacter sp. CY261 TaxID=2907203 RepID=UPI001F20A575|nr:hypothetical protein [Dyadobacter sp. CY261]MCF0074335.1 hypothetical protein [Dyadobacter sp. CY261]